MTQETEIKDKGKTVEIPKNVTQRQWIFGDFDHDGAKNVDDRFPMNPKRQRYGKLVSKKAQLSTSEAKLTDEILEIEKHNNSFIGVLNKFTAEHPHHSYGRIKSVPSTMHKLREKYIERLDDIAGATIIVDKRKQVAKEVRGIKKRYPNVKRREDNYYRKPKDGVYFAHHLSVRASNEGRNRKKMMEIQVKTNKMHLLQDRMHSAYKDKEGFKLLIPSYKKESRKLFKAGY